MHDPDSKRFVAAISMAVLFVGIWMAAAHFGYIQFTDTRKVFYFLAFTSCLWIVEVFVAGIAGSNYSFSDHGLQLTTLSLTSLVALDTSANLDRYKNAELRLGLGIVLASIVILLFVNVRKRNQQGLLPWRFRLLSVLLGVTAVETYILVCLSQEIQAWHL